MKAEQAVFASADSSRMKGYQLVARSAGIDRSMAQELCRWAPSHSGLTHRDSRAWSINYFRIDDSRVAVTRTTYGGPEYSARGGMQVVTLFLVVSRDQMAGYANNPLAVARTALALGYLRLTPTEGDQLPPLSLPDRPVPIKPPRDAGEGEDIGDDVLETALGLLLESRRVAVVGKSDPIAAASRLLDRVPLKARLDISFTTGLNWSMQRDFQLHFLPSADPALQQRLAAQDITCAGR